MASDKLFGSIPPGWQYKTLGLACAEGGGDIQTGPFGSLLHAADYVPVGIPSIMPQNIGDNRIMEKGIARITAEDAQRLSRYIVRDGDIVYSRRGDVERRALVRPQEDGWLCGTGCLRVRLGENGADPLFVSLYLGHPSVREWIVRHAHGATMPNLNTSILSACPFIEPPLGELRAIAHILGTLDDKIELNRKQNETLEAMARALFKAWFVDFEPVRAKMDGRWLRGQSLPGLPAHLYDLFPDRLVESELGEIPEGWEIRKIKDCCELVQNGGTPKRNEPRFWENGRIPWLTSGEVRRPIVIATGSFITEEGLSESSAKWVPAFSTVVALYGATAGQVSLTSHQLTTNQAVCALIPKDKFELFNYLTMREAVAELESKAVGSAQQNISKGIVESIRLAHPSVVLIDRFSKMVSPLFKGWISNLGESRSLAQLRDTLLPKLISGELRVPDAKALLGDTNYE